MIFFFMPASGNFFHPLLDRSHGTHHKTRPLQGASQQQADSLPGMQDSPATRDWIIVAGNLDRLAHAHFICQNAATHIGVLLVAHPCQTCASRYVAKWRNVHGRIARVLLLRTSFTGLLSGKAAWERPGPCIHHRTDCASVTTPRSCLMC